MKTILSVASARPNFVKLAAVHHALAAHSQDFIHLIVHTGQHYDPLLSDVFFKQLHIPDPAVNLGIAGGDRQEVISRTDHAMEQALRDFNPEIVLVYGDVNGAVGAARAAHRLGIKLGHVEAGLRSYDSSMPEEANRIEIDRLADLLFCSEQSGMDHLEEEEVPGKRYLVGNTMIDTLFAHKKILTALLPTMKDQLSTLEGGRYAIATIHRPSNVDDPAVLQKVIAFLKKVAVHCPTLLVAHPRLQKALDAIGFSNTENVPLILRPPMGYVEFINWMNHASFILTDSGGIQEEAVFLGKRCFTLRRNTERPSTMESGSNVLIDPDKQEDVDTVLAFASDPKDPAVIVPQFWDGNTGERIVEILAADR